MKPNRFEDIKKHIKSMSNTSEKNTKKTFDAVKFMREQRDRISKDIMNLSPEEIVEYFENQKSKTRKKPSA